MPATARKDPAHDDKTIVRALKALSDAKRFRMVQELAAAGELCCGGLAAKFDLSQPTISHHLKILADAGIIQTRGDAQQHFLSVNREFLAELSALIPLRLAEPKKKKK